MQTTVAPSLTLGLPVYNSQYLPHVPLRDRITHAALTAHGVTIDSEGFGYARSRKHKVDCNAVYKLLDEGLWWSLLEGKRLTIVSGNADELTTRLVDSEFVEATGGGEISWSVATNIICPDKTVAKQEFWSRVRDELFAKEWDLLLCSARRARCRR